MLESRKNQPQGFLLTAIKRLRPGLKIITQIRSGKIIPLPAYQSENSGNYYAIKWLYKAAQDRKSKGFTIKDLVQEIRDASKKKGLAFKSKIDLIKEIRASRVNIRKSFRKFKPFRKHTFRFKPNKRKLLKHTSASCSIDKKKKNFPLEAKTLYNNRYLNRLNPKISEEETEPVNDNEIEHLKNQNTNIENQNNIQTNKKFN